MKHFSKQFILLIILVVVAVLVVGVFVVQKRADIPVSVVENGEKQENQWEKEDGNTNSNEVDVDENVMTMVESYDVSDWQSYLNEELGFSVKIPPTFDINDPRIYEDETYSIKNICFPDKQDIQHYQNEGKVDIGPRLLCFGTSSLEGNMTTEELMDAWENSSNKFMNYNVTLSNNILSKLYFGYSSGVIFDFGKSQWSIQDSYSFNSSTVFDDVSNLYYLGIIKTFTFFDEEVGGM